MCIVRWRIPRLNPNWPKWPEEIMFKWVGIGLMAAFLSHVVVEKIGKSVTGA